MSESKADIGQEILKILEPGEYEKTNYLNRDGKRWVWLRYVNEQVESGHHQINLLCESVQKIAVKAGIMREDAAPNWAETLMLGDDILKQMAAKDEAYATIERALIDLDTQLTTANAAATKLTNQLGDSEAEVRAKDEDQYIPGVHRCPKCEFQMVSKAISSNGIGALDQPEECMNGCGPMWRVTYKDSYINEGKSLERLEEVLDERDATIKELKIRCSVAEANARIVAVNQGAIE